MTGIQTVDVVTVAFFVSEMDGSPKTSLTSSSISS